LPTSGNTFQGRNPPLGFCPRCRPHDTGTGTPRAPTPGTGVAPPASQRGRPWQLCRPKHASLPAVSPPPGWSAWDRSAPAPEGRLVGVRAGGAGYVGSISVQGKRTAAPMSAGCGCGSDCGGVVRDHASRARSIICFLLFSHCAILVASYHSQSLPHQSSAVFRSTPRRAGGSPKNLKGLHHRDGLPRERPHPQFRRRRRKTPMVTTPKRILVFIRLTLLRRLPRRESM